MTGYQVQNLRTRTPEIALRNLSARRAFSIIDLLVSMAVITVLIGLLLPSISAVREAARQVVCASNVRQHGLGIAMYADDYQGFLPYSKFGNRDRATQFQPQLMTMLHTEEAPQVWDGLGILFAQEYLEAPGVFYCPSHRNGHVLNTYLPNWASRTGRIEGNYQFRGGISQRLYSLANEQSLVTDALRSQSDFNHGVGANVLRADFVVGWFDDSSRKFRSRLPMLVTELDAAMKVDDAWTRIDAEFTPRH